MFMPVAAQKSRAKARRKRICDVVSGPFGADLAGIIRDNVLPDEA
jgi:hypothetical protein